MPDLDQFRSHGESAVLSGATGVDAAPQVGKPRWGVSAVLRPEESIAVKMTALASEAEAHAGPGHWWHDAVSLHVTLRCLEAYSGRELDGDSHVASYAAALDNACGGFGPVELELRGVAVHQTGIMLLAHSSSQALPRLRARYVSALEARQIVHYEGFVRDLWYLNLAHFAAPVAHPRGLVEWARRNVDRHLGTVRFDAVQLVGWLPRDRGIVPRALHISTLDA